MGTIYIRKTGNDTTGDGSLGNPYLTIEKGYSVAVAGDIINIEAGATFAENNFNFNRSGTAASRIILESDDYNDRAFVSFSSSRSDIVADYITFRYINFNGGNGFFNVGTTGVTRATGIIFSNCVFAHTRNDAVICRNAQDPLFEYCHFVDNRTRVTGDGASGIYSRDDVDNLQIKNCTFEDNGEDAVYLETGTLITRMRYCIGFINRGRGAVSDRDVRPWRDFSNAYTTTGFGGRCGEGPLLDVKTVTDTEIAYCVGYGGRAASESDPLDISGGDPGHPIVFHVNADQGVIAWNRIFDNSRGISLSRGAGETGKTTNMRLVGNIVHNPSSGSAIAIKGCEANLILDHNAVYNAVNAALAISESAISRVANNIFINGGSFSRGGNTGEISANFQNNATYNTAAGWPTAWFPANNVTITDSPDILVDDSYAPLSTSDIVDNGVNIGEATDLMGQSFGIPVDLGPLAPRPTNASTTMLNYTGLSRYYWGEFDTISDNYNRINMWHVDWSSNPEWAGRTGLYCWVGSDQQQGWFTKTYTSRSTAKIDFRLKLDSLSGTVNESFCFHKLRGSGADVARINVRFDGDGNRYLTAWIRDDNDVEQYLGGGSGQLVDGDWHHWEFEFDFANGVITCWKDGTQTVQTTGIDSDTKATDEYRIGVMNFENTPGGDEPWDAAFYMHSILLTEATGSSSEGGGGGGGSNPGPIYVATTGNDTTGDGTSGNPYATLGKAQSVAAAGADIFIGGGTYTEGFTITNDGAGGSAIVVQAQDTSDMPVLQINATGINIEGNYWTFHNLIFESGASGIGISLGSATATGNNIGFYDCVFRHIDTDGLTLTNTDGTVIQGCSFYDCRSRSAGVNASCITVDGTANNISISATLFEDFGTAAIFFAATASNCSGWSIFRCVSWINRTYGSSTRAHHDFSTNAGTVGFYLREVENVTIADCLFYDIQNAVAGQDSADYAGWAIRILDGANNVTIERVRIRECDNGLEIDNGIDDTQYGTVFTIKNVIISDQSSTTGTAIRLEDVNGVKLINCTVDLDNATETYLALGQTGTLTTVIDEISDCLFTNGGAVSSVSGTITVTDMNNNAYYGLDSGEPPSVLVDASNVTVTTLGINSYQAITSSSSDLDAAGRASGYPIFDFLREDRPFTGNTAASIGAIERYLDAYYASNVVHYDNGRHLFEDNFYTAVGESGVPGIVPYPVPNSSSDWGYRIFHSSGYVTAEERSFDLDIAPLTRIGIEFYINTAQFQAVADLDKFDIVNVRDGGDLKLAMRVEYDNASDKWGIFCRIKDDAGAFTKFPSSANVALDRDTWYVIRLDGKISSGPGNNDGFGKLYIDEADASTTTLQDEVTSFDNDTMDWDYVYFGLLGSTDEFGDPDNEGGTLFIHSLKITNDGIDTSSAATSPLLLIKERSILDPTKGLKA